MAVSWILNPNPMNVKVLIKHLAIFFLLPAKKFLPISFKIQLLETSPKKLNFEFVAVFLLFTFCQVCLPFKETAEIETGMAEKSSSDQANIRQKLGLV
jgi:hypothetical protein